MGSPKGQGDTKLLGQIEARKKQALKGGARDCSRGGRAHTGLKGLQSVTGDYLASFWKFENTPSLSAPLSPELLSSRSALTDEPQCCSSDWPFELVHGDNSSLGAKVYARIHVHSLVINIMDLTGAQHTTNNNTYHTLYCKCHINN